MIAWEFTADRPRMAIVHFNRIAMQRGWPEVWTVHTSQGCFNVLEVRMRCPMDSIFNPNGRQPRAKFKGKAFVQITRGVATLS